MSIYIAISLVISSISLGISIVTLIDRYFYERDKRNIKNITQHFQVEKGKP